jgi:hypothetical protein
MQLLNPSLNGNERDELEHFSEWVLAIGDGTVSVEKKERSVRLLGLQFLMIY